MALPASGQITLNQVNVELGVSGTAQRGLGDSTTRALFGVSSGQITMSNGYGAANIFAFTISSSTQEVNLSSLATSAGWNGSALLEVTINSGVYLWSNNTSNAGLLVNVANAKVYNSGRIIGKGGTGGSGTNGQSAAGAGGSAIIISSGISGVTIQNNSGAYIAGGGGGGRGGVGGASVGAGGGGGAGGGNGGTAEHNSYAVGVGGAIGQSGTTSSAGTGFNGGGGGAGAGGGATNNGGSGYHYVGVGGGGGRILPGSGGSAGGGAFNTWAEQGSAGGSANNAGSSGSSAGGQGGGGWGALGGTNYDGPAAAGGKAINDNGVSYTLSNSGTIYGAT